MKSDVAQHYIAIAETCLREANKLGDEAETTELLRYAKEQIDHAVWACTAVESEGSVR